jgi:hypothetical protein
MLYGTAYLDEYGRPSLFIQGDSLLADLPNDFDLIEAIVVHPKTETEG